MAGASIHSAPQLKGIYVITPYNERFVFSLKELVPREFCIWEMAAQRWYVFQDYAEQVVRLVRSFFPDVNLSGYRTPETEKAEEAPYQGYSTKSNTWEFNPTYTKRRYIDADGNVGPWEDIEIPFTQENYRQGGQYTGGPFEGFGGGFDYRYQQRARDSQYRRESFWGQWDQSHSQRPEPSAPPSSDHAVLFVLPSAPPEVIRAAYKALATLYHPDKIGGNAEKMKSLNAAMDRLKKTGKA